MVSPAPGGFVVGIDLGTSNTVAVIRSPDGRRRPVLFDGAPLMPSAVFLQDNGQLAVGRDAIRLAQLDPGRYEPNPKRRIDEPMVLLGNAEIPTVHMLAAILRAAAVGVAEITRFAPPVVLTYPASWGQTRRRTLYDAAIAAGWQQVEMIPEPVAAARYFISALNHPLPRGEAMVVYDFGGGTIDIAVVRNEPQGFVVIGSGGLEDVGGLDLDATLVELLGGVLQTTEPEVWRRLQDPRTAQDRRDRRMFWEDIRGAKEMLSRTTVAPVSVPGVEAAMHLTREELENKIGPMIARTVTETARVVRESGLQASGLAGIMLVGGSSRVPLVARMLHRELQVVPTVLEQPELPVAEGAVVHPAELTTDGRFGVATGSAAVGVPVPKPPVITGPPPLQTYGTESMPVSGVPAPVSGVPAVMPVSGMPMSGAGAGAAPVSAIPGGGVGAVASVPVSPAGFAAAAAPADVDTRPGTRPEESATGGGSRRGALIAGFAVVLLLLVGGAWALKSYNSNDDQQAGGGPSSSASAVTPIGKWEALPDVPAPVGFEAAGAAVVDGKLYVIGGYTAVEPRKQVKSVYVYDIAKKTWSDGPDLPAPASHMAVVVDGKGDIWVMGGWVTGGGSDSVWKLPNGTKVWQEGPKLPQGRVGGTAVNDSDGIVFAGGTNPDHDATDTIWALGDTGWKEIGRLSDRREKLASASDGAGTVWFIGGVQQTDGNKAKDTIDIIQHHNKYVDGNLRLDHPREAPSAVNLEGIGLCVFGGHDGGTVYGWWCKNSAKTALLPKQPVPRSGMAVAVSGGVVYAVGGYDTANNVNGTKTVEAFKYTRD
ncbi:hypothetical protein GCM10022255_047160 [Dactylosporangium darangshiense]|uniref:Uncharacterized protein n=1 Tax=Dactylosporangium darangshiense TaxID=579108 RepID=A0ABP8DBS6_9ACTN